MAIVWGPSLITVNGELLGLIEPVATKLPSSQSYDHYTSCVVLHSQKLDQTSDSLTQAISRQRYTSSFGRPELRSLRRRVTTMIESATQARAQRSGVSLITAVRTGNQSKNYGCTTSTHTIGKTKFISDLQRKRSTTHTPLTTGAYPYGRHKIRKFTWPTHRRYVRKNVRKYLSRAKD